MGISAIAALIALALALIGQSPQFLRRSGLSGARLDMRVRTFTGFAFALLLLAFGFFIAGVPIGNQGTETIPPMISDSAPTALQSTVPVSPATGNVIGGELQASVSATRATPETGSFDGPPQRTADAENNQTNEAVISLDAVEENRSTPVDSPASPVSSTATPTPSPGASATPSPSPTLTPTPSLTPTPLSGETTTVETQGSTVWLRRSPGGQNLTLIHDGDQVFILTGHANQGGIIWSEIRTLQGVIGWLQEDLLLLEE